ncbi:MAG TPA: 30S ribosomal protein S4e [candidate division Zixibacteria bacterium]|nr:30S ribosomal protein S4e [candidate division Zixibacteria bacterium]
MGKKGQSSGLKRKPAPRFWPIHRKEFTWVVKPTSGPHSLEKCMPLGLMLRDTLRLAETRKEAKTIVSQGRVYVDGNIRTKDDFPIGLLDVISIPDVGKSFCVLPSYKGLILKEISSEDAKFKLCRVEDKTVVRKGQVQLHLHDGSNILVKIADFKNPQEDVYDTLDTVKISLPEKQVLEHIKLKEKDFVIITGGKNIGNWGKAVEIEKAEGKKRRNALVTVENEKGNSYQTTLNFVFAIGEAQSLISLEEAV